MSEKPTVHHRPKATRASTAPAVASALRLRKLTYDRAFAGEGSHFSSSICPVEAAEAGRLIVGNG